MSHYFSVALVQISTRGRRLVVVSLLSLIVLLSGGSASWAGSITSNPQVETYDWTVKSGLATIVLEEGLRVVITEATQSATGVVARVRFFDKGSEMLGEYTGTVLPSSPLVATFYNEGGGNENWMLVRFEIEFFSTDLGVVPVTSVERERPGDLVLNEYICAGPSLDSGAVRNCENPQADCGPPPPWIFPCGALVGFSLNL